MVPFRCKTTDGPGWAMTTHLNDGIIWVVVVLDSGLCDCYRLSDLFDSSFSIQNFGGTDD